MHLQPLHAALTVTLLPLALTHPLLGRDRGLSAAQVLAVAPKSASCDNAPAEGQCRTAEQATLPILNSFLAYNITYPGQMAAVIGIMAFESDSFKYDKPIDGTPGKGTRNMQSGDFNLKYAASIPELSQPMAGSSDANKALTLLTSNDYYDFGSGAWFLATQCDPAVRSGLDSGSLAGWQAYITTCINTQPTPERQGFWEQAKQALAV